eukprot:9015204-Ditylum_brightwellii.AAC.1
MAVSSLLQWQPFLLPKRQQNCHPMPQAKYATGNFKQKVAEGSMTACMQVSTSIDNVASVKLPMYKIYKTGASFVTMDEALNVTNRRVNALENVTIPKIQGILDYIAHELDELEHERTSPFSSL